jgi:hypothetical protein
MFRATHAETPRTPRKTKDKMNYPAASSWVSKKTETFGAALSEVEGRRKRRGIGLVTRQR